MPRADVHFCKYCRRSTEEVGPLSWTRQCTECSGVRLAENVAGMVTRSGPEWKRWRRAMAASVGGTLLDDSQAGA